MASEHSLHCNRCDFSVKQRYYRPFYINDDGSKEYIRTPIGGSAKKRIDGFEDKAYCKDCRIPVVLTYQYKPYKEPKNNILKFIKEAIFILKTINGRKIIKPLPSCPHCERRDFLSAEDACVQCGEGIIESRLLWIS